MLRAVKLHGSAAWKKVEGSCMEECGRYRCCVTRHVLAACVLQDAVLRLSESFEKCTVSGPRGGWSTEYSPGPPDTAAPVRSMQTDVRLSNSIEEQLS